MPTPQSFEQYFNLFGCITAVYVAARLSIKAIYYTLIWTINRMEE